MDFDPVLIEPRRRAMEDAGLWPGKTFLDYFEAVLAARPEARALSTVVVSDGTRRDLSWAELDDLSWRAAAGLHRLGLKKNDVLSCQLSNSWEYVVLCIACFKLGVVFNPVMPIFRERELLFMLKHGETKAFVVPKVFRKFDHEVMAEGMRPQLPDLEHIVVVGGAGPNSFEAVLLDPALAVDDALRARSLQDRAGPDEVCELIYTSGTTGEPKGVMHTANTIFANMVPLSERLGLGANDVTLMASPMAHQTGFGYGLMLPVMLGARMVLIDSWEKTVAARLIEAEGVTFTMASTPFVMDLCDAVTALGADASSLRVFLCSGTVIPGPVAERARAVLGTKLFSAWGMTEIGVVTIVSPSDPDERSINSDGFPLPGVDLQLRGADGQPVGVGQEGEIHVRASSNFAGYLKRPQLNATDAEGWFHTGDLGTIDDKGYIRISGRSKDLIIRGAENIPVVEVEELLYKHPAVSMVAIVAYPDERLGERACAFVVPKPGAGFTFEEMVKFLESQHLARQYFPERLEVRDELPSTSTGKIQKFALRNALKAEYEARSK